MTEAAVEIVPDRGTATNPGLRSVSVGALTLALGELDARYIRFDGVETIRRLFVAVRDVDWGTAPMVAEDVAIDVQGDSLRSSVTALCEKAEYGIQLRWRGVLRCQGDAGIEYAFHGTALGSFAFARIGLCVLFPPKFAGASYEANTPTGWISGELQEAIAPQLPGEHGFGEPLFPAFDELRVRLRDGTGVHLKLFGDLFELEDQRNWGDASFKAYTTPLHLGAQFAERGQAIEQRVVITPLAPPSALRRRVQGSMSIPTVGLGGESRRVVPDIGVVYTPEEDNQPALGLLRALGLAHLRIETSLDGADWQTRLRGAGLAGKSLDAPMELAITHAGDLQVLGELAAIIAELQLPIARVLVFRRGAAISEPEDVIAVRQRLADAGIRALVYGGTDAHFADLNAARPSLDVLDGIAFPLVPTVHADDDLSLVETTTVCADIIRTARTFTRDLPLAVTPITLLERPHADARQVSLLGAVWTLGAMSGFALAGAESVTLFEAVGPAGVLTMHREAPHVHPVYHVLADLCGWRGFRVLWSHSSDPLSVACLAAKSQTDAVSAVIVNMLPQQNRVRLAGFGDGTPRLRRLNEANLEQAARDPIAFRQGAEELSSSLIDLSPHELVRLDANP